MRLHRKPHCPESSPLRQIPPRCLNVLPEAIGTLVLSLLKTYGAEIEQGALVVADERRQRDQT